MAVERITAPATLHDFRHALGAASGNRWTVVDARIHNLAKDLAERLSFVGCLATVNLVQDHAKRVNIAAGIVLGSSSQIFWSQPVFIQEATISKVGVADF